MNSAKDYRSTALPLSYGVLFNTRQGSQFVLRILHEIIAYYISSHKGNQKAAGSSRVGGMFFFTVDFSGN